MASREVNRLICAAVVSERFRERLLTDPPAALRSGYAGESFSLPPDELALILSHQANSLPQLAELIVRAKPSLPSSGSK